MANQNSNSSANGGITFTSLLLIAFIVLKLTGAITWPWVWVLAPGWITGAIVILFLIILFIVALLK